MPCNFAYRLFKIIVHLVDALHFCILCSADKLSFLKGRLTDICPVLRLIGDHLCDNVHRPLQGFFDIVNAFLLAHIGCCLLRQRLGGLLCKKNRSKPVKPFFLGNARARLSLRSVGQIQILHCHHGLGCKNFLLELVSEFSLFLDAA